MLPIISRRLRPVLALATLLVCAFRLFAYEPYADWRQRHFTPAQLSDPISADGHDANSDGLPNLLHFAYGLSPWESPPTGLTGPGVTPDGEHLTFHFPRRLGPGDIRYQPEFSFDLTGWHFGPDYFSVQGRQPVDADLELVTIRSQTPLSLDGRQFFRLRAARIVDADFDGLDDAWELLHFGDLEQGYYDDYDRDGIINGEDQWTGADPVRGNAARDSAPPSWTAGAALTVTDETAGGFTLNWPEAVDDRPGTLRYVAYRNNQPLGAASTARTLAISTADLTGMQRWHIRPVDTAGNIGAPSGTVERELVAVVAAAFSTLSRGAGATQAMWGWKEFVTATGATPKWYSKKTEVYDREGRYLFKIGDVYESTDNSTISRTTVTDQPLPGQQTVSCTGLVDITSSAKESNVFAYHYITSGAWSGSGQFDGTTESLVPAEPTVILTSFTVPGITGTITYPDSITESVEDHWVGPPFDDGATGHNYRNGSITTTLSDEVTEERLISALRAALPAFEQQTWGAQPATAAFYRTHEVSQTPAVTLSESEYKLTIPATEPGRRYRVRWLELFHPWAPTGEPPPPPVSRDYHEWIVEGTGEAVESEVHTLAAPTTEGSVSLVGVDIGLDAPLAIAVNENFDERVEDDTSEWTPDNESPSPLRADGTVALTDLAPLWANSGASGGGPTFGPGTRGVRLSVVSGGERVRLHALAPAGSGEDETYLEGDWRLLESGEDLWGLAYGRTDGEGATQPDWRLYVEGLEPGKVDLRLDVDRYGETLSELKTLYVTRTELVVRDPDEENPHVIGGLLEGGVARPSVELHVDSALLNASGDELTVHVSGTVSDPLSETLIDALLRTWSLAFEINGRTVDGIVNLPALATGDLLRPWQNAPFTVSFERTLRVPVRGPGTKIIRAVTSPGALGRRGWDECAILLGREPADGLPGSGALEPLRVLAIHEGDGTPAGFVQPAVLRIDGLAEAPDDLPVAVNANGREELMAPLTFSPRYFYVVGANRPGQPTRFLVTLDDSVPLPSKEALRVVSAGAGNFALRVGNRIVGEAVVQAVPALGSPAPAAAIPRPATDLEEIRNLYKFTYERPTPGDGGVQIGRKMLFGFDELHGLLQIVQGDEVNGTVDGTGRLVISVGAELDAFSAAQGMFEALVVLAGKIDSPLRNWIESDAGSHADFLNGPRLASVRAQSHEIGAVVLQLYRTAMSLIPGAGWAIALDDVSLGDYSAAVGLIPFVPAGAKFLLKNKRTGAVMAEFSEEAVAHLGAAMRAMKLDKVRGRLNVVRGLRDMRAAGYVDQRLIDTMVESGHLTITNSRGYKQLKEVLGPPPSFFGYEAHHWIPLEEGIQKSALKRCIDPNEHGIWLNQAIHQRIHNVPVPEFTYRGKTFPQSNYNGFWRVFFDENHFQAATDQEILDFVHFLQTSVYKITP